MELTGIYFSKQWNIFSAIPHTDSYFSLSFGNNFDILFANDN